jgi:hypothetical protein
MSKYPYKRLDLSKNEIRILRLLDSVNMSQPHLVNLTLEHVSLDDLLPEFREFLSTERLPLTPNATRAWVHAHCSQTDCLEFDPPCHPLVAA